jgi:capsid protein
MAKSQPASQEKQHLLLVKRGAPDRQMQASYDAAETTTWNQDHWRRADALSADEANSPEVRKTLRERSRYEVGNNSFAKGMVRTLALDLVGNGPLCVLETGDESWNIAVQQKFWQWMRAIRFRQKLSLLRIAKCESGEGFAEFITNWQLPRRKGRNGHPVMLDVRVTECDQYETPFAMLDPERQVSGVVYDEYSGDPLSYHRLKHHPGDPIGDGLRYDEIDAERVIHLFDRWRPGQHRGIPEVTPSLPLFAQMRRYGQAVLGSAETAAKYAVVLATQASALAAGDVPVNTEIDEFSAVDIDYDMMVAAPYGWEPKQMKAEQPTTTHNEFQRSLMREAGSPVRMPINVSMGDSSEYNYASTRQDYQSYDAAVSAERDYFEEDCCDRVFDEWFSEAMLIDGYLPRPFPREVELRRHPDLPVMIVGEIPRGWLWGGREHVDPDKASKAQERKLKLGLTSLAREWAKEGEDFETQIERMAREFGVSGEQMRQAIFHTIYSGGSNEQQKGTAKSPAPAAAV